MNGERYPGVGPRLGHVQAVGLTAGGDAAAGQQRIDAASGAQVHDRLAGAQVGHCDRVAAFATGVGLELSPLAAPIGVLAAATGVARGVNGVHFPSDIAGGFAVGVAAEMLSLRWLPLRRPEPAAAAGPRHEEPAAPPETDSTP